MKTKNGCSMWSEWIAIRNNTVPDGMFVPVLVLLSIKIEGTIFLGGESLH